MNKGTLRHSDILNIFRALSDEDLLRQTLDKTAQERNLTAEVLKLLEEINRRKLFAARGFSSLYAFCVEYLGYSEASAHRRVASVYLMSQVPEVEEKIRNGSLTLSNVAQAQVFFQAEAKNKNPLSTHEKRTLLEKLEGKSARQAERELIGLSSNPEALISKDRIRPITQDHYEIKFIADQALLDLLTQVRGLLAHKNPNFTTAELISEMAKMTLVQLKPKKPKEKVRGKDKSEKSSNENALGENSLKEKLKAELIEEPGEKQKEDLTEMLMDKQSNTLKEESKNEPAIESTLWPMLVPKNGTLKEEESNQKTPTSERSKRTRYIKKATRSEVYYRDQESCSYVDPVSGRRCGSIRALEFDHFITPFAKGGENTASNLALRCRQHNLYSAAQVYGAQMEKYWNQND